MKSKSKTEVSDNGSFDYIHLYKSAAETTVKLKADHEVGPEPARKINKRNKKKKVLEIVNDNQKVSKSVIENTETALPSNNETTMNNKADTKSIIKNPSNTSGVSKTKPKKRNKSVSFVLDEKDEVTVKKTKSENCTVDSIKTESAEIKSKGNKDRKKFKKTIKAIKSEKENDNAIGMLNENIKDKNTLTDRKQMSQPNQENIESKDDGCVEIEIKKNRESKKSRNKHKLKENGDLKQNVKMLPDNESNNTQLSKKSNKKKRSPKSTENNNTTEGEPATKTRKQDIKPDVVAKDLENLNIGDNTHTLTNLLDEMAVVDKKKQKKRKHDKKNVKQPATPTADVDLEGSNEKQKWKKKRWNKDKKPLKRNDQYLSLVIVDNLPIGIILNYKKLLQEHFAKCGLIKRIGTVEVYPSDNPKPVFSTTILFDSENGALKALEEDNISFQGSFIRVKKALPPKETTLVVRSYGELTQQALSSTFNGAGRIRNIEIVHKRKKLMTSAFVEFDGPLDFDRLAKIAADTKIGSKPIYIARFEYRTPTKSDQGNNSVANETAGDSDSSDD